MIDLLVCAGHATDLDAGRRIRCAPIWREGRSVLASLLAPRRGYMLLRGCLVLVSHRAPWWTRPPRSRVATFWSKRP